MPWVCNCDSTSIYPLNQHIWSQLPKEQRGELIWEKTNSFSRQSGKELTKIMSSLISFEMFLPMLALLKTRQHVNIYITTKYKYPIKPSMIKLLSVRNQWQQNEYHESFTDRDYLLRILATFELIDAKSLTQKNQSYHMH